MSELPDETSVSDDTARLCEEARALAENGEGERAAGLFRRVLAAGDTPERARAALGLAVVLDDAGDAEGAREADRAAIATGDPEYGPRAAYHLALTHERAGEPDRAAPAWRTVVDFGNPAYLPPAHLALARLADDADDPDTAREHWEAVIGTGDPEYGPLAAHDLAQRLLERGEPARAQRALTAGLRLIDRDTAPYAYGRLAVALGIAYLDQAIGAFGAALDASAAEGAADPDAAPLATELLARTLPLRGRSAEAREVWRRGLADPGVAGQVRARLRRDFGDDADPGDLWWEPVVEQAVSDGTLPALTGEAFGALDHMYALLAVRHAEDPPGADGPGTREAVGGAVRVPSDYAWGPLLHESFAERLRLATGAAALPPGWPDA